MVGISLAMLNFGAWSMVFARLAGVSVGVIVLWSTVRWRPTLTFSLNRLKALFSFSSKVLFTNLMNTLFNNMHSLIIGRYYTAADLGYYQRGQQFPQAAMAAVDGSMSEVLYPAFSRVQNDVGLLKRAVRRSIKTSMYIVLPILFGLMVTAHNLTLVLLTEKWLPSVPFMQLACIICMFWPLSHRSHALNAMGLSDVTLKLSLIGKCTTLVCILLFVRMGIFAIMFGTIVASVISFGVTTFYINKYLHYSLRELAVDVLPSLLGAAGMSVVVVIVGRMIDSPIVALIIQIIIGGGMYLMFSIIMNNESFNYIWLIIKPHIEKIFHYKRAQH